jgi:hypothetical protein
MTERHIDLGVWVALDLCDVERSGPEGQTAQQVVTVDDQAADSGSVHNSSFILDGPYVAR